MKYIPVMPTVASRILGYAGDTISFRELEQIIILDPGLTTKVLKVANSALYSRQNEIKSIQMAISLLGIKNIKSLAMLVTAANLYKDRAKEPFYRFFWRHSVMTAFTAKSIALKQKNTAIAEEAFVAGLLHDIGKTGLYNAYAERYLSIVEENKHSLCGLTDVEKSVFGVTHKQIGNEILHKWHFPDVYVDTACEHGGLNITSPHKTVIITITIADMFACALVSPAFWDEVQKDVLPFLPHIHFPHDLVLYYRNNFLEELQNDRLFMETLSLFR